jgi:hypothetical protein
MIKIEVVEMPKKDGFAGVKITTGKVIAGDLRERIGKRLRDESCKNHPDFQNVVTIWAGDPVPEIKFTSVCCQEFQDSIVFQ